MTLPKHKIRYCITAGYGLEVPALMIHFKRHRSVDTNVETKHTKCILFCVKKYLQTDVFCVSDIFKGLLANRQVPAIHKFSIKGFAVIPVFQEMHPLRGAIQPAFR